MTLLVSAAAQEFRRICSELEALALQTVANRKKFQLAVSQFRSFTDSLSKNASSDPMDPLQLESYRAVVEITREYHQLFGQHMLHCWAHSALDSSSTAVPTELCALAGRLREAASPLDAASALFFDPDSAQWLQYHMLDLRAISASFNQYITSADGTDPVIPLMTTRLNSINDFLRDFQGESSAPTRFFSPLPVNYRSWRLNHSDFSILREIGSGVSATVYYGTDMRNNNAVAIKKLKFKKLSGQKLRTFQREILVLATANHPSLLGFVGATDTPPFCILTEWMGGGNLYQELHRYRKMSPTQLTIAAFDIALGMQYLHSLQIIHRDLKSLNVLFDSDGNAKICDFGFSRRVDREETLTMNIGTPHWMAPELLSSEGGYGSKVDVYAYGIVLWEILAKKLPFAGLEATQIVAQVLIHDARPALPKDAPDGLRELIVKCWSRDPEERPSFDEIVRMFRQNKIFLPGADVTEVAAIISKRCGQEITVDPDSGNIEAILDSLDSVSPEISEKLFEAVKDDDEKFLKGIFGFLKSPVAVKAAKRLREMPSGSLSLPLIREILSLVPTGNESLDEDLMVAACRNSAADEAVLASLQPNHTKLAMEVLARTGVKRNDKAVIERCVSSLSSTDTMLVVAAIRCLVSMGNARCIPLSTIRAHIQSKHLTLRMAAYVATAKMAEEGAQIPIDLIDAFSTKWETEPIVGTIVVVAAKDVEVSRHLLTRIAYGASAPVEIATRILAQASYHPELRENVAAAIAKIDVTHARKEVRELLLGLKDKVLK